MESKFSATSHSRAMPVADLLRRMGKELRDLTHTVERLQLVVGRLVSGGGMRDSDAVHELQHFDRLGQTLSAIADFAEALSGDAPAQWLLNPHSASRAVLLSDLAARLVSQLETTPVSNSSIAGEFEFF
ncbi:MAG: hypothetical protein ABSE69_06980 [Roseiarcus sp.]|jgi:hypothetical protein